ncbi:MAG: hypothetical protein V4604_08305 [Bacteroidota bacterium]
MNCFAQQDSVSVQTLKTRESFWNLTDTTIRNEIASFNLKGDSIKQRAAVKAVKLTEIPLVSCSDTVANFHLKSAYIHLYFSDFDFTDHQLSYYAGKGLDSILLIDNQPFWGTNGKLPKRKVSDVFFVLHSHYLVDFPPAAFTGIYEPWLCDWEYIPSGKNVHREPLATANLRLLKSEKSNHMYLYMLNGEGENRYEVTWIVENGGYLTRVVDGL